MTSRPNASPDSLGSPNSLAVPPAQSLLTDAGGGRQHLLFELHGALYAVEALAVREVHQLPEPTPLAEGPPFLAGVINLRGRVVPVVDLARRLGQATQPCRASDCLIVLESGEGALAIVASAVRGVQAIAPEQIEAVPLRLDLRSDQGQGSDPSFARHVLVRGLARVGEEVASLLCPEALLASGAANPPASTWGAENRFSTAHLPPHEQSAMRERALRLMESEGAQEAAATFPVALVALGGECYGLALGGVREFCEMRQASPVPCCPPHILGQMNLRGDIVTLLDIQPLLQMPARDSTHASSQGSSRPGCVVVATHRGAPVGIVVDSVLDVLYLAEHQVRALGAGVGDSKYLEGAILHGDRMICLLDLPRVLAEGGLDVDETV